MDDAEKLIKGINYKMKITEIKSYPDLQEKIKNKDLTYVLIYKKGSEISECAIKNITEGTDKESDLELFTVDVSEVRDVHERYSISSAPTLLSFEKGVFKNTYKGCNDKDNKTKRLKNGSPHWNKTKEKLALVLRHFT